MDPISEFINSILVAFGIVDAPAPSVVTNVKAALNTGTTDSSLKTLVGQSYNDTVNVIMPDALTANDRLTPYAPMPAVITPIPIPAPLTVPQTAGLPQVTVDHAPPWIRGYNPILVSPEEF